MSNDTTTEPGPGALIFDDEAATQFAITQTGLDPTTIAAVFAARDRYGVGMGVLPDDWLEGVTPAAIRAEAPELFPAAHMAERYVSTERELAYVARTTGFVSATVEAVLQADFDYQVKVGIMLPVSAGGVS